MPVRGRVVLSDSEDDDTMLDNPPRRQRVHLIQDEGEEDAEAAGYESDGIENDEAAVLRRVAREKYMDAVQVEVVGKPRWIVSGIHPDKDNNYETNLVPVVANIVKEPVVQRRRSNSRNGHLRWVHVILNMQSYNKVCYWIGSIKHPKATKQFAYKCICHQEQLGYLFGVEHKKSGVIFLVGADCLLKFGLSEADCNKWKYAAKTAALPLPLELRKNLYGRPKKFNMGACKLIRS